MLKIGDLNLIIKRPIKEKNKKVKMMRDLTKKYLPTKKKNPAKQEKE